MVYCVVGEGDMERSFLLNTAAANHRSTAAHRLAIEILRR